MEQTHESEADTFIAEPDQQPSLPPVAEPVATVPRSTMNYMLIAIIFFALGLIIGVFFMDRQVQLNQDENRALIAQAVEAAVAAAGGGQGDTAAAPQLNPSQRYTVDTAGNPSRGSATAPVTVIEFSDFRCSFCKRFHDTTFDPLLEQFGDQIQFVVRDYPIFGQASYEAALAAECAHDQGKYWEYYDSLFADQTTLTRDGFLARAETLGLDVATFTTCFDDETHLQEIVADYQAGEALGVGGTPTFFVNGRPLVGAQPIDAFINLIEEELAAANGGTESSS
ncbi:MAG: thioredoxin domain-containing protein [Anaerolineae bacterium]|nr:thioredoxin domain-containing protein [Anaerolineae bacterium]